LLGLTNNPSAAAVALATQAKDKAEEEWLTYHLTLKALHQQLLKAVPHRWISKLADEETDFAGVPPIAILTLLWQKHGKISQTMLADNLTSLSKEWNPTEPMTNLWEHVKKCTDLAACAKEPMHQDVVLRAILGTLEATGEFTLDIRDWKKLPEKEKTIVNMQTFFEEANDQRLATATTSTKGYACRAEQDNKRKFDTSNDCQQLKYCWSHGLNQSHDSMNCNKQLPNHNKKATLLNMLGGNNLIVRLRYEQELWKGNKRQRTDDGNGNGNGNGNDNGNGNGNGNGNHNGGCNGRSNGGCNGYQNGGNNGNRNGNQQQDDANSANNAPE
jgi:hypothetical protein